jgi:hypothetical protein
LRLVKKLTNANASNLLITADHGFIYQNRPSGGERLFEHRAEGTKSVTATAALCWAGAAGHPSFRTFSPEQLGLAGTLEVQIPSPSIACA